MQAREVIPFLAVKTMADSLAFYIEKLGFEMELKWEPDGAIHWCQLRLGKAGLMLQEFAPVEGGRGSGVTLCFFVGDAVEYYRAIAGRGVAASVPCVENGLWAAHVVDPDGYRLLFESPTDVVEGTMLGENDSAA